MNCLYFEPKQIQQKSEPAPAGQACHKNPSFPNLPQNSRGRAFVHRDSLGNLSLGNFRPRLIQSMHGSTRLLVCEASQWEASFAPRLQRYGTVCGFGKTSGGLSPCRNALTACESFLKALPQCRRVSSCASICSGT